LDRSAFHLSCGSRSVRLSRKEFDLAELLMRNRGQILTKETLLLKIWGYESEAEDNNVEAYISFLRKKLEHLRSRVKIRTIRMVGYMLEESES
jgi:DNA-binding response OmpR family regulator